MADFVAVIRRAVDGLSDNTPELRAKVYEKARGAVLRQLESMKPRPPEEMLRRQIDKLESAIQEVEAEHSEALPSVEEAETVAPEPVAVEPEAPAVAVAPAAVVPAVTPAPEVPAAPVALAPTHAEPVAVAAPVEPVSPEPHAARPYLWGDESWAGEEQATAAAPADEPAYRPAEPAGWQHPAFNDPIAQEPVAATAEPDDEPAADFPVEDPTRQYARFEVISTSADDEPEAWPKDDVEAEATASPADEPWTDQAGLEDETADKAETGFVAEAAPVVDPLSPEEAQERTSLVDLGPQPVAQGTHSAAELDSLDASVLRTAPEDVTPAAVAKAPIVEEAAPEEEEDEDDSTPVVEWVVVRSPSPPAEEIEAGTAPAADAAPVYIPAQPFTPVPSYTPSHTPAQPASTASARATAPAWDQSPFNDVLLPEVDAPVSTKGREEEPEGTLPRQTDDDWEQYDDFTGFGEADVKAGQEESLDDAAFAPLDKPARSFRVQQRRRIDLTSVGLGLLGLILVAGSGYGAWVFRDTLSGLVTGLVSTPPQDSKQVTPPAPSSQATGSEATDPAAATATAPATTKPAGNQLATAEPAEAELQKFTQRLKEDGSEVDEGKASDGSAITGAEGKSVAPQTVASTEPAPVTPPVKSVETPAPAAIPVGVSQKMFLYEERVGQTSPVAVEGAVVWSLKHELADNGKNEAIVQGQVTAPDRGLSAQITFKRNLDPSLPASHLVELVFSLPKDFDGGAIESVQRVSMKQTEQDRGDALVAVPAKITDDFHMIALNDYADARAFNLKLLQTRDWIDIPLTYRNGRRALLTMQKGSTGADAFTQAIREWEAEDGPASGGSGTGGTQTTPSTTPAAPASQAPANP